MRSPGRLKRAVARLATAPPIRRSLSPLVRHRPIVFMLHRFVAPHGIGSPLADLRAALEQVREARIPMVSLREMVQRLLEGESRLSVAFSVDDGYEDFARLAAPVFTEFDCPVTVFAATGFLDGHYWYWWDKINYAIGRTTRTRVLLPELDPRGLPLATPHDRHLAAERIFHWVKGASEEDRDRRVASVLASLAVEVPQEPPAEFRPLSWDLARTLEARGVDFGPHTVTHPTLASISPSSVAREVAGSYARLREELEDPVPIFCYPYGSSGDVSDAAAEAIAGEGMRAALTAEPGYLALGRRTGAFRLPRFALPDNPLDTAQILYGFERLKELARQVGPRGHNGR